MQPLTPFGGVTVHGPLLSDHSSTLLDLLKTHGLIEITGAGLTRESLSDLIDLLGCRIRPPFLPEITEGSGITLLENSTQYSSFDRKSEVVFASDWHGDWTFMASPPDVSILFCEQAPESGGDTLFADTSASVQNFSSSMMRMLSKLTAVHSSGKSYSGGSPYATRTVVGATPAIQSENQVADHPVVWTSLDPSKRCLSPSPAYTTHLKNLFQNEGSIFLNLLYNQMYIDECLLRIKWAPNTLVLWDNRRYQHRGLNQGLLGTRRLLRANLHVPE